MKAIAAILFLLSPIGLIAQNLQAQLDAPASAKAAVLGPGIISDGLNNRDFALSPNGDEIFYTIQSARFLKSTIVQIKKVGGVWQKAQIAPFSGMHRDLEAFFSPDGKSVFFASDRPADTKDSVPDFDIWKVEKTGNIWGKPQHLGFEVNSPKNEFYPSVARSGTLYFTAQLANGFGEDIVKCAYRDGKFLKPELLDSAINTKGDEFNAFVDPDENYIIFSSYKGRKDEQGGGDLYISKKLNNKWQTAVNMGNNINSASLDYCPFVTPDKKKLYFASNRSNLKEAKTPDFNSLITLLNTPGNTSDDIYFVDITSFFK